jgi:hypothetical protein
VQRHPPGAASVAGMADAADDHGDMLAAGRVALAEARRRADRAAEIVQIVAGLLASGLREQGHSDRAIGAALQISRNRVSELVDRAPVVKLSVPVDADDDWVGDWIEDIYGRASAAGPSTWVQDRPYLSGHVVLDNAIPVPAPLTDADLDTSGAQFRNADTGERILVYSLQRWRGTPEFAADTGEHTDWDHRGHYSVELRAANGRRRAMPPEMLGLTVDATCFGSGWEEPGRRQSDGAAFRRIVAAVRRRYGVWPQIGSRHIQR